jgi:hypothetical protein
MPDLPRVCLATETMSPYTQIAAGLGQSRSVGSGVRAFRQSERTRSGVSIPSRVVRSIILIAASSAQALEVVFIDLVPRPAARASKPTLSTPGRECNQRRRLKLVIFPPTIASGSFLGNFFYSLEVSSESKANLQIGLWALDLRALVQVRGPKMEKIQPLGVEAGFSVELDLLTRPVNSL